MDLAARIQQLEETIREAKSMPLSASVIVNREEMLEMVSGMREALPEEIKQARWVVKDREELLAKARRDAESLIDKANAEQRRLVSQQAVVQEAHDEAERVLSEAREHARQIRLEAEDYMDGKLAQFEIWLQKIEDALARTGGALKKTGDQVSVARERLRGPAHPAQALADQQPAGQER